MKRTVTLPAPSDGPARPLGRALQWIAPTIILGLFFVAVWKIRESLRGYTFETLWSDLANFSTTQLTLALLACVVAYGLMAAYDVLALEYVEHPLGYRHVAAASFAATAMGNSLGALGVAGAALRVRLYSGWGVPGFAITRMIGFNVATLHLGALFLAGVTLVLDPGNLSQRINLPVGARLAGGIALLLVAAYLLWCGGNRAAARWGDWRIDRPHRSLAVRQIAISTVDWIAASSILYVLLPTEAQIGWLTFAGVFSAAIMISLASSIPGGLGVFEVIMFAALAPVVSPLELTGALVAFRFIFYLMPLGVAAVVIAILEAQMARQNSGTARPARSLSILAPSVLAVFVAVTGVVLIGRGHIPVLAQAAPLSTFTGSLTGLMLVLLAHGLHRRFKGAWSAALGLSVLAAGLALFQHAWVVLGITVAVAASLTLAKSAFYRTRVSPDGGSGMLFAVPVVMAWLATVGWHDVMGRGQHLGEQPWWYLVIGHGIALTTRVLMVVAVLAVIFMAIRALSPARSRGARAAQEQTQRAERIVHQFGNCTAHLLFTGDKRVIFSTGGEAFIMYQIEGSSWVSMGDPVGNPEQFQDVVWKFAEAADRHACRPVFYSVGQEFTDLYREVGLSLVKLGEEAWIDLREFHLKGKEKAKLRQRRNLVVRAGCEIEFLDPADVIPLIPELREVSDSWLRSRAAQEKTFSLGAFDEEYVARFPTAVVRVEGKICAFANMWQSADLSEIQVDLMRYREDAPRNVMTYVFLETMQWAKDEGYETFVLGMAPLSGLRTEGTGTFWARIGDLMWRYGERFYNFKGLRHFKETFDPQWRVRYVAAPAGPTLPKSMLHVATLVGGGMRGMLTRT